MNYDWLNLQAEYDFYKACCQQWGSTWQVLRYPADDEVATYCMGGEL